MPTLMFDSCNMGQGRAILLPLEDNEDCLRALDWTIKEVVQEGDVLHLLHIIPTCHPFGSGVFTVSQPSSPRKSADFEEKLEVDQARNWMEDRFAAVAKESDVAHALIVEKAPSGNQVGEAICGRAADLSATLVVLPATSRGSGTAYFEGSITQFVIANCKSAVLAWRDDAAMM
jgi:nucleotide-binding universal stress UspA family protein